MNNDIKIDLANKITRLNKGLEWLRSDYEAYKKIELNSFNNTVKISINDKVVCSPFLNEINHDFFKKIFDEFMKNKFAEIQKYELELSELLSKIND